MKKRKLNYFRVFMVIILFVIIIMGIYLIIGKPSDKTDASDDNQPANNIFTEITTTVPITTETTTTTNNFMEYPKYGTQASYFSEEYTSLNAVLMNVNTNEIIAYKNHEIRMYPASLTKVMSLIVAVENIESLSDTVTITAEMIDPMIEMDASRAGFLAGEQPTVEDLIYGMILPSGADATLALAQYVAGSESAFVALMNEKCTKLGLRNTNFTNPVGLHNDNHYSTAVDMALILKYAMENDYCRKILETYEYTTTPNSEYNPEGILLTSTMFARMSGEEMPGVKVLGGKTGYTDQALNCLSSFATINGQEYILVLCGNPSRWYAIYDTLSIYSVYCYNGLPYVPE